VNEKSVSEAHSLNFTPKFMKLLRSVLIALPILTIILLPRPDIPGAQFFLFPILGVAVLLIILTLPAERPWILQNTKLMMVVTATFLVLISNAISMLANHSMIRSPLELMRPILLFGLVLAGTSLCRFKNGTIAKAFAGAGVFLVFAQITVGVAQLLNVPIFNSIYSSDKTRGLEALFFRVTGTIGNPNAFAWFLIQSSFLTICFSKWRLRWLILVPVFFGILISGSRSNLIVFPIAIAVMKLAQLRSLSIGRILGLLLATIFVFVCLVGVVILFPRYFSYLSELLKIAETGSLDSVTTFALRLKLWASRFAIFNSSMADHKWILGLGTTEDFRVLDNDYLYIFFKYGILGLVTHLLSIATMIYVFMKCSSLSLRTYGLQYIVCAIALGFQADTMGGWFFPLIPFYLLGLALIKEREGGAVA